MAYPPTTGTPQATAFGPQEDPAQWSPNKLNVWDRITFYGADTRGTTLPLASPPEGGVARDIDKKKSPGNDFARITDKGYDIVPIKIELLLWRDNWYGTDYLAEYERIRDQLMPKRLEARNAVSLYHPSLNAEGIQAILVSKRGNIIHQSKQMFRVSIEGYDVRNFVASRNTTKTASKQSQNKLYSSNVGIQVPTSQSQGRGFVVTGTPQDTIPVAPTAAGEGTVLAPTFGPELPAGGLPRSQTAGPARGQRGKV